MSTQVEERDRVTLAEVLDKVIETGAVVDGEIVIRVADIDLVYVGLRLILTSVSQAEGMSHQDLAEHNREASLEETRQIQELQAEIRRAEENISLLIDGASPQQAEQGVAKLVLTLVELLRKVMAKEACRRVKRGALSPVQVQKLGLSLKAMQKKVQEMQAIFGIEDKDLNLDLGPLGSLM
jgi:cell division protein FtsB